MRFYYESPSESGRLACGPWAVVTGDDLPAERDFVWTRGDHSEPIRYEIAKHYNDRELLPIWGELQKLKKKMRLLSDGPEAEIHIKYYRPRIRLLRSVVSKFTDWYRRCGFELPVEEKGAVSKEVKGHRTARQIYESGALDNDAQSLAELIRRARPVLERNDAEFNVDSYARSLKRAGFYPNNVGGNSKAEKDERKLAKCCENIRKFCEEEVFPPLPK